MDNLAHSLVGLTSAKAGLERLSPYATTVCVVSANAADADVVTLFFGDRWTFLEHHRGITHSIIGTIVIGLLVALIAFAIERIAGWARARTARIRLPGLLLASLAAAATHPVMDWTNNYGIRPLMPWSDRWFYGDLVFIADPYVWLGLGCTAFLLTSGTRAKVFGWAVLATIATAVIVLAAVRGARSSGALWAAGIVWIAGIILVITLRMFGANRSVGRRTAIAALLLLIVYWGGLALMHRAAYANTVSIADEVAADHGEKFIRGAAMPTLATPFSWQSVAETDRALYRFTVGVGPVNQPRAGEEVDRFEKPTGETARLISIGEKTRDAQVLLGFARFPIAKLSESNCVGHTLVQLADLRYTEPGARRGSFSVDIPVDCPAP
jgi:inner membrane protein